MMNHGKSNNSSVSIHELSYLLRFCVLTIKTINPQAMILKPFLIVTGVLAISLNMQQARVSESEFNTSVYADMSKGKFDQLNLLYYTNLKTLDLSENGIQVMPSSYDNLQALNKLILNRNSNLNLNSVYDFVSSPLNSLSVNRCGIYHVSAGISKLSALENLDLSHNYLSVLNYEMAALKKLKHIDLSNNLLVRLDYAPNFWWNLESIDVRNNPDLDMKSFYNALLYLDNLNVIKMSGLKKVPSNFKDLPSKNIIVENAPDIQFDGALASNTTIVRIDFYGEIKALNSIINEANASQSLTEMKLNCGLKELPTALINATSISTLDISNNSISSIDLLKDLSHINVLNLSGNPLSSDQIATLSDFLPETEIVFDPVDIQAPEPLNFSAPIADKDVPFETKTIDVSKNTNLVFGDARFSVPANAFLDKDGQVVNGPVKIEYRDLSDPASIILSGVPMKYDSAGNQYNFSSAGMFEFRAFDETGNELQPNPENAIDMSFESRTNASEYSMYAFNEDENRWTPANMRSNVDNRDLNVGSKLKSTDWAKYLTLSGFSSRIAANRIYTEHVSFKVRKHRKSNGFVFQFQRHDLKLPKNVKRLSQVRALQGYQLAYDGDNYGEDLNYLDSISCIMRDVYRKELRTTGFAKSAPVFINDVRLEPSSDPNNKILVIEYKDTTLRYPVYPYLEDKNTDNMVRYSSRFLLKYNRRNKITQRKNSNIERGLKSEIRKIEHDMKRAGFDIKIDQYEEELKRYALKSMDNVRAFRSVAMPNFGVVNCDVIKRLNRPEYVLASFYATDKADRSISVVYYVDYKEVMILPQTDLTKVLIDAKSDFSLVFLDDKGAIGILPKERLNTFDYSKTTCKIPIEFIDTENLSVAEIKDLIMV